MKYDVRCPKCLVIISDVGYKMPSRYVSHIKEKHPEDFKRLEEAKEKLENIKKEYDTFHFMYYLQMNLKSKKKRLIKK